MPPAVLARAARLAQVADHRLTVHALGFEARSVPSFRAVNTAGARAEVHVYEPIGLFLDDAKEFVQMVGRITAPTIDLRVNSPGGIVWAALAMAEALRRHPARVEATVDGVAASAATLLLMAADRVSIVPVGRTMVHPVQIVTAGDAEDLRQVADEIAQMTEDVAGQYAARAGGTAADWLVRMKANGRRGTWYNAAESVRVGLADQVVGAAAGAQEAAQNREAARLRALFEQKRAAGTRQNVDKSAAIRARAAALVAAHRSRARREAATAAIRARHAANVRPMQVAGLHPSAGRFF